MTNTDARLDRIENDLETVKEILMAVARRAEATDSRLERLANADVKRWSAIDSRLDRLTQNQERTQEQLDQLRSDVDIAFDTITALSNNTDRTLASINASIQRQDRILDYLMRRDGSGNGDQPQP